MENFFSTFETLAENAGKRALGLAEQFINDNQFTLPVDMTETDTEVVVKAEAAGLSRDDFDVKITGNRLTIIGTKSVVRVGKVLLNESRNGAFSRTVILPVAVSNRDQVDITCENGILQVLVRKDPDVSTLEF